VDSFAGAFSFFGESFFGLSFLESSDFFAMI
jgi:hypothetical protein